MRVTHMMQFQQALDTIQQQQARLLRAQEEASSGKKILRPSDNPVDTRRILELRQDLAAFTQLQRHRESLKASLGATENTLQGVETALMRAKEIALNGANGSVSAADREILSQEVDQLFKQVVQLGNTDLDGRFLFAGRASTQPPFTAAGTFTGDSRSTQLGIDIQQRLEADIVGSEFLASDLRPALDPTTPLSSLHRGQGVTLASIQLTDRVGNTATIDLSAATTVDDVLTAISNAPGVNITAAINTAGNGITITDDNAPPTQNLTITEVGSGTVARALGIAADRPGDIVGAPLQPAVTASTPLSALYDGEGVSLSALHIANGATEVDVDLSAALTVGDVLTAINGAGVNVTASINSNGTALEVRSNDPATVAIVTDTDGGSSAARLGIQGGHDILKALQLLQEALAQDDQSAIGKLTTHLDAGLEQLLALRGEVGARLRRLELVDESQADLQLTMTTTLSQLEDVDPAEAFVHLSQQSTAWQAALASTARLLQPTLLDFLR
jgi:flagellar hook-associated protein 3 FlgL